MLFFTVIARNEAIPNSGTSLRGTKPSLQERHCEERSNLNLKERNFKMPWYLFPFNSMRLLREALAMTVLNGMLGFKLRMIYATSSRGTNEL